MGFDINQIMPATSKTFLLSWVISVSPRSFVRIDCYITLKFFCKYKAISRIKKRKPVLRHVKKTEVTKNNA